MSKNARCLRLIALLFLVTAFGQRPESGQTQYVVGIRRKGPSWIADFNTPEAKRLLEGHVAVIKRMTASGKLIAAGPFNDPNELRGLLIFRDCTIDQAQAMANEDPVVKSGQISIEFHIWMPQPGVRADQ